MNQDKKWWADNIRSTLGDDLTELVDSMRAHGWVAEFPALTDEHGVMLVGHRRMRAAALAGVEPIVRTISFGDGDAADARRVRLAIVSNIGAKPLTAEDRKRIAEHLYDKREWSMTRIGEALGVSQRTISSDLGNLEVTSKLKSRPKTESNPKGAGRPKSAPRTTKAGLSETTQAIREQVRPLVEAGAPITVSEVVAETGHSRIVTEAAIAAERGRLEGLKEAEALRPVDVATLGATAKERIEALERRLVARMEAMTEQRVAAGVREGLRQALEARAEEERMIIERANDLIAQNQGRGRKPFTPQEYHQTLLWALHPDCNDPAKRTAAFVLVRKRKLSLCDEGPIHRKSDDAIPLPKTREELLARRKSARRV